jgi:hypothetical protein
VSCAAADFVPEHRRELLTGVPRPSILAASPSIACSVAQLRNVAVSGTFAAGDATDDVQFVKLAVAESAQHRIVRSASTFLGRRRPPCP